MPHAPANRPVWAPWRIEYILSPKDGECFFCRKGEDRDRDVPNHVIARGDTAFVLLNDYPYNPGHLLIAPYRHVDDLEKLTLDERREIFDLTIACESVLRAVMQPHGFNMGCNLGEIAGAGVKDHVHLHVVPRWSGDTNFMPVLADTRCVPESLDATCSLLRDAWT